MEKQRLFKYIMKYTEKIVEALKEFDNETNNLSISVDLESSYIYVSNRNWDTSKGAFDECSFEFMKKEAKKNEEQKIENGNV